MKDSNLKKRREREKVNVAVTDKKKHKVREYLKVTTTTAANAATDRISGPALRHDCECYLLLLLVLLRRTA